LSFWIQENRIYDFDKLWRLIMDEKKNALTKKVEDTMACSAFAEAGEPCPINEDKKESGEKEGSTMSVEDTMACSAFAEAGEPCPIDEDKKEE
jgi:hypothetical protein